MEIHFKIIGVLFMALAFIHAIFPKYFNWKEELKNLGIMNRQMMGVHTFFIALTVFLMGLLCFTSATELISTALGSKVTLGLAVFWSIRLVMQIFVYSPKLWKGKIFETVIHILSTIFWVHISWVFWVSYIN